MIEDTIDYLQCSIPYREQTCIDREYAEISPLKFYQRGYEDPLGVRRYFGNPNTTKSLCVYSGKALHNHRALGWELRETIGNLIEKGGNITRIDLCLTEYVEDDLITVDDVVKSYGNNEFVGTLAKYGGKQIIGVMPKKLKEDTQLATETFYIGSMDRRGKNGIFRAYDKGLEMGGFAKQLITRLELEERKENAHSSAKRYADGAKIGALMNSRLSSTSKQWERVVGSDTVDLSRGQQLQQSDENEAHERRKNWLIKQVLPALAEVIRKEPQFAEKYNSLLLEELSDIM